MKHAHGLRAGDWVEVRSQEEILRTLDKSGRLDEMPFMPEMFQYCGKRLRVYASAHKTCDTVNKTGGLRLKGTVHLDGIRCDGQAHGGCEAGCLIFWKEAWLRRTSGEEAKRPEKSRHKPRAGVAAPQTSSLCRVEDVVAATTVKQDGSGENTVYSCQATQLPKASRPLKWSELDQYWKDLVSGNVGPITMIKGVAYAGYYHLIESGRGPTAFLTSLYDFIQSKRGGVPFPRKRGRLPKGKRAPSPELNLQEGELVRVKSYDQILETLHEDNRHRGLFFDAEMVPYCGGVYRVRSRVSKILNEKTGEMMHFKNDCIVLDGVVCQSRYSDKRYFCPRAIFSYWREAWLERVDEARRPAIAAVAPKPPARVGSTDDHAVEATHNKV